MYWDITSLATSQVGHQRLFSRFIHVTFESDNPQWLTDYGTLFYSTQYSWLPNLWQLFGKRKGHEWSHRQVWVVNNGFVGLGEDLGSSWRKSLVKIHHKACQHTALLDVSLKLCTVCPQAMSTVGACGDLGRLLIAAALKMANCRVISQPGKLPRNQSFHVPICLHPHFM